MAVQDGEKDEEEPEQMVGVIRPKRGPNREGMTSEYLPGEEDWVAKTALDLNDPARVAALRQFHVFFPEIEELQPTINEFVDDFLKARTSVQGSSREEFLEILVSMYGGRKDDEKGWSRLAQAFGAVDDDD